MLNSILRELSAVRYGYHVGPENNLHAEDGAQLAWQWWDTCRVARPQDLLQHGTGCCIDQSAFIASRLHECGIPWHHIRVYITIASVYDTNGNFMGVGAHFVTLAKYQDVWWVLENTHPTRNGAFRFSSYADAIESVHNALRELGIGTKGFDMEGIMTIADMRDFTMGGATYIEAARNTLDVSAETTAWFDAMEEWIEQNRQSIPNK